MEGPIDFNLRRVSALRQSGGQVTLALEAQFRLSNLFFDLSTIYSTPTTSLLPTFTDSKHSKQCEKCTSTPHADRLKGKIYENTLEQADN